MINDYFNDFQASIFAFLKSVRADWTSQGLTQDMDIVKFDAHADLTRLPHKDLVGPLELSIESDDSLQQASVMLGVSTHEDHNIVRLDKMTGDLYWRVRPSETFPLLKASDGSTYGMIKVMNGTRVMPVLNTDTRAVRTIGVRLAADTVPTP